MSIRETQLWAELTATWRDECGDWTDDEIAAVVSKVHAKTPDDLPDALGRVLAWCAAAQSSGDEEAIATVQLWQHPQLPIEITIGEDGAVYHAIEPGIEVEFTE